MADHNDTSTSSSRRYRPNRRRPSSSGGAEEAPTVFTEEFLGLAVSFSNTLLFIGYEVNGLVEIVVYPRYRFSADDRVRGYLGYLWVPFGESWERILEDVERIHDRAQENYRLAVTQRTLETRAHGSRYEAAYEAITDIFRESWHGFSLRLRRESSFTKEGVEFSGRPPGPILARWQGHLYTIMVFPTGSITMATGDQRDRLKSA